MNINIIYEPYILSLIIASIIGIIYYFFQKNKNENKDGNNDENNDENNLLSETIITLLISYIILMIIYYSYKYLSFQKSSLALMTGGSVLNASRNEEIEENEEKKRIKSETIENSVTVCDDDTDDIDYDILSKL